MMLSFSTALLVEKTELHPVPMMAVLKAAPMVDPKAATKAVYRVAMMGA